MGEVKIASDSSNPKAPGILSSHYNPVIPVRLFESLDELLIQYNQLIGRQLVC